MITSDTPIYSRYSRDVFLEFPSFVQKFDLEKMKYAIRQISTGPLIDHLKEMTFRQLQKSKIGLPGEVLSRIHEYAECWNETRLLMNQVAIFQCGPRPMRISPRLLPEIGSTKITADNIHLIARTLLKKCTGMPNVLLDLVCNYYIDEPAELIPQFRQIEVTTEGRSTPLAYMAFAMELLAKNLITSLKDSRVALFRARDRVFQDRLRFSVQLEEFIRVREVAMLLLKNGANPFVSEFTEEASDDRLSIQYHTAPRVNRTVLEHMQQICNMIMVEGVHHKTTLHMTELASHLKELGASLDQAALNWQGVSLDQAVLDVQEDEVESQVSEDVQEDEVESQVSEGERKELFQLTSPGKEKSGSISVQDDQVLYPTRSSKCYKLRVCYIITKLMLQVISLLAVGYYNSRREKDKQPKVTKYGP